MHEFDEICYGKTIKELNEELNYQIENDGLPSLIVYIEDCIYRLQNESAHKVYWHY